MERAANRKQGGLVCPTTSSFGQPRKPPPLPKQGAWVYTHEKLQMLHIIQIAARRWDKGGFLGGVTKTWGLKLS